MIERLKSLYQQEKFKYPDERCDECTFWKSYCFDEYDADSWCALELNPQEKYCLKFSEEKQ